MNIDQWLKESPKPEEVLSLNKDGTGKYIPYEIIVEKLYQLCGHDWHAYNLQVTYFNLPNRRTLVSATIEVEVNYCFTGKSGLTIVKRKLPGASNFIVNGTKIPYTSASSKSLAIMNAVKPLGKQFGWQLNEGEEMTPKEAYADEDKKLQIAGYIEAITTATSLKAVEIFKKLVDRENIPEVTEVYNLKIKELRKQSPKSKKIDLP